jgi:hypothetical protein
MRRTSTCYGRMFPATLVRTENEDIMALLMDIAVRT